MAFNYCDAGYVWQYVRTTLSSRHREGVSLYVYLCEEAVWPSSAHVVLFCMHVEAGKALLLIRPVRPMHSYPKDEDLSLVNNLRLIEFRMNSSNAVARVNCLWNVIWIECYDDEGWAGRIVRRWSIDHLLLLPCSPLNVMLNEDAGGICFEVNLINRTNMPASDCTMYMCLR